MTDRPARSDAIDISPVDDGCVVYDPASDLVHHLNPTAAVTLELCDGQRTADDIAGFVAELFTGAHDVHANVISCISQLRDLGLVRPAGPAARSPERTPAAHA